MVCAVDMGFMSTSRNRMTPVHYMASGGADNVLWCLQPAPESDSAYHRGADISRLSQFAGEEEGVARACSLTPSVRFAALTHQCSLAMLSHLAPRSDVCTMAPHHAPFFDAPSRCGPTVLFPPCTMLEVKKVSAEELQEHDRAESSGSPKKLSEVVQTATNVRTLHDVISRQGTRQSHTETRRFRVNSDCNEGDKRFVSIDVLPHFL